MSKESSNNDLVTSRVRNVQRTGKVRIVKITSSKLASPEETDYQYVNGEPPDDLKFSSASNLSFTKDASDENGGDEKDVT